MWRSIERFEQPVPIAEVELHRGRVARTRRNADLTERDRAVPRSPNSSFRDVEQVFAVFSPTSSHEPRLYGDRPEK